MVEYSPPARTGPEDALDPANRTREYEQPDGYRPHHAVRMVDPETGETTVQIVPQT